MRAMDGGPAPGLQPAADPCSRELRRSTWAMGHWGPQAVPGQPPLRLADLSRRVQRVLAHASVIVPINQMHIWVGVAKTLEVYHGEAYVPALARAQRRPAIPARW